MSGNKQIKHVRAIMHRATRNTWASRGLKLMVIALIFSVGYGFGNGRISLHARGTQSANLPAHLNYSTVDSVYKSLIANYNGKLTETQLEDGLKHGLAEATKDPYTVFFTAKEAKDFNSDLNQSLTGIGAQLDQDSDKNVIVEYPIVGSPAETAGIKAKDIITEVNGTSTTGMSINDVVKKIRGPKGTKVTVQVLRDNADLKDFTITRDTIVVPTVVTKTLDGNIGYMQVTSFSENTSALAKQAADKFKQQGVKGIILDLRNNGGGYLDAAVNLSSLWVPQGKTILQERGTEGTKTYHAEGGNELTGIPTVILVNGGTASASEITTGALHDNKAAYVIGEKSFGKGVVQTLINFDDGSQLKVTIASWYRPDGENINHKGITPDQTAKISDDDAKAGNDTQLQAAQAYLNK